MRPDETASASTQKEGKSEEDINFLERAQNFEEAFNKIKSSTGISDIDEVVKTFIKNEDHNFSLFNYVTEQNNEVRCCVFCLYSLYLYLSISRSRSSLLLSPRLTILALMFDSLY